MTIILTDAEAAFAEDAISVNNELFDAQLPPPTPEAVAEWARLTPTVEGNVLHLPDLDAPPAKWLLAQCEEMHDEPEFPHRNAAGGLAWKLREAGVKADAEDGP